MEYLLIGNNSDLSNCIWYVCSAECPKFDICAVVCDFTACGAHCASHCLSDCPCYQEINGIPVFLNSVS